jgi:RimJ/RimL family protein N-acetyltransferase
MGHDPEIAARILTEPGTVVYELGDFGGIIIVTDLPSDDQEDGERIARPHIFIWDKACFGQTDALRAWALEMMRKLNIYRLVSEVPVTNRLALAFDGRMGFNRIGVLRDRRFKPDTAPVNCVLFDALQRDLDR